MADIKNWGVQVWTVDKRGDARGWLMELFRSDLLLPDHQPAMAYVSCTLPGVMRGPHMHQQQTDLFVFLSGQFRLQLLPYDSLMTHHRCPRAPECLVIESPTAVLVPPGIIHAYTNVSAEPGLVFNAPNRLYAGPGKRYPVDEQRLEESEFAMEVFSGKDGLPE